MKRRKWSARDDRQLVMWWCHKDITEIAAMLGRTPKAIAHRARFKGLGVRRDTETLSELSARTGYTPRQLRRAMRSLRIHRVRNQARVSASPTLSNPRNRGRARAFAISDWLADRILRRLGQETLEAVSNPWWAPRMKLRQCQKCGTSASPHMAKGLCQRCYDHQRLYGEQGAA